MTTYVNENTNENSVPGEKPKKTKRTIAALLQQQSMELTLKHVYALACGDGNNHVVIKKIIRETCPEIAWW